MDLIRRPRRLRKNALVRRMVTETHANREGLVYPVFFEEGKDLKAPIAGMDGQYRFSPDRACELIDDMLEHGVRRVLLFGIPAHKDEHGSSAYAEDGIVQEAIRAIRREYKDEVYIVTDVCMCEYTSHGHCGILHGHDVDNDTTLGYLTKIALSHAEAGADMVAPSDMMDGRIAAIREGLDAHGFKDIGIMSYAVKYASAFYGPFRAAADSAPAFGDRRSYQMDPPNGKEAMLEALLDEDEGADILIVKPALSYLDVTKELSANTYLPIATYSVSGEYAMIKNAGKAGLIDEYKIMCETTTSMFRAGANILLTYYAREIADAIRKGDIG